jgi:S-disulfanyl-L-cysteine oxidoreductase SoxD
MMFERMFVAPLRVSDPGAQTGGYRREDPMVGIRVAVGALLVSCVLPAAGRAQEATPPPAAPAVQISVETGVYTEDQAKKGAATVELICSTCHQPKWFGGPEWKEHWGFGEVYWVYDFIRKNMPYGQPGTLSNQEYRDVVAYMLKNAGYKAGTTELPRTDEGMMGIVFPTPNPPKR